MENKSNGARPKHTEKRQILVVEDEAIIAEGLRRRLTSLGYAVSAIADTGVTAVRKAEEIQPDLVLMDIKLPGEMDGVEAAEQIRIRFDIPVIYVTGYTDEATLQRAKVTEPLGYIVKPVETGELRSSIEMAFYRHKVEKELRGSNLRLEETLTELRETREKLVKQERLAAVGQLAGGIAHGFNNALVPITLYSQLLLARLELSPRDRSHLESILDQAKYAATLSEQILGFSQRSILRIQALDMIPFLEDCYQRVVKRLPKNIQIEFAHGTDECAINGDPTLLQQVFMNLAQNAVDAMPNGGKLSFHLSRLRIETSESPLVNDMPPGEWIQVNVEDTGVGIQSVYQQHLFEPFFTTTEAGEGVGLGLAQVYGILRQHKGYIEVKSQVDVGTTFSIYLPVAAELQTVKTIADKESKDDLIQESILVVDDNQDAREAICEVLQVQNYRILQAKSGREGLMIFKQERVDLVLINLMTPEMGAAKFCASLQEIDPEVGMVIITSHPLGEENEELLQLGINSWIRKPFALETFLKAVRETLDLNDMKL